MTSRPSRSIAFARASTEKAVSVPSLSRLAASSRWRTGGTGQSNTVPARAVAYFRRDAATRTSVLLAAEAVQQAAPDPRLLQRPAQRREVERVPLRRRHL